MYLYHLTLQPPTAITTAVVGSFSAPKMHEIVVGRGRLLELLRIDQEGKPVSIHRVEVFGVIRSLIAFRLTGGNRDYLVVGSDSGRITILEFDGAATRFKRVHLETFGRSGCRRIVPGELLAADPRGRAVMIGALEKQKFVYILNRDSATNLTISSPLEAHKSHTICFDLVGVDVGFDNPIFACLEVDYSDVENGEEYVKNLTFFELDLGLNHVVRKWSDAVNPRANKLITVPGGADGPGGVLVCAENYIYWKTQTYPEVAAPIPRRKGMPADASLLITASAAFKRKAGFFFLLQSELGDLYKVTLDYKADQVTAISIMYFDTVPVANALCVLTVGFLFVAAEGGNHLVYAFKSSGDDDDGSVVDQDDDFIYFQPRPLRNLILADEIESLSPLTNVVVKDLAREEMVQLYAATGANSSSALKVLRYGLPVGEMAVSQLPSNPTAVWTVKSSASQEYDTYIVVSFANATLVLAIGDTVEEVSEADSGFLLSSPTLNVYQIGEDTVLQVLPSALRNIRADKRVHEWRSPGSKNITHAAVNKRQIVISLSGGELYYFNVDIGGQLIEIAKKEMGNEVLCIDIAPIPSGRLHARYLAVGDTETVRILSLDAGDCLQSLALLSLQSSPYSLSLTEMKGEGDGRTTIYLTAGLYDGVLLRSVVDTITGELSDTRRRLLGSRPVKLTKLTLNGASAVLASSSRPWLLYSYQLRLHLVPLSYVPLDHASSFSSESCPEGIVAVAQNTLRIFAPDKYGDPFNQQEVPLRYTPRRSVVHPQSNFLITIQSDHKSVAIEKRPSYRSSSSSSSSMDVEDKKPNAEGDEQQQEEEEEGDWEREQRLVPIKPANGTWASCLQVFDPLQREVMQILELEENEAALSLCTCTFSARRNETFVIVGTAKDLQWNPRSCSQGFLHVYASHDGGMHFELLHKTPVDNIPSVVHPFQGRLLAGVGSSLRIYDIGKHKLLRKCENKNIPSLIKTIDTQGDRIIVGDASESFFFLKYKRSENQLYIFADDVVSRAVTASATLDFDTVAGGDKYGNVFVLRLPKDISEEIEQDATGAALKLGKPVLNGAPHKLASIINFHVGEAVTSLARTSLIPGGSEVLLYTTLHGAIGVFVPFVSREDVDFFTHLEMHVRQENNPLCGRDHLAYRSFYFPVKDVVDGDLCEQYAFLKADVKAKIADELDRKPSEVLKKLEDIRNRCL